MPSPHFGSLCLTRAHRQSNPPHRREAGYEIKISSPEFYPNQLDNANAMRRLVHKIDDHTQHEAADERTMEGD